MSRLEQLSFRSLSTRSAAVLSVRIAGAGAGFLFNVVLARLLGAEQSGAYALALTISVITSVVARMGMDSAVLKFASAAYATHDTAALHIVERTIHKVVLAPTLILGAIGVIFAPWIAESIFRDPALEAPLRWMAASIPAFSLANLYGELLRAADRHVMSAVLQGATVPILNTIILLVLSSHVYDSSYASVIYLFSSVVAFVVAFSAWRKVISSEVKSDPEIASFDSNVIRKTAFQMYLATVSGVLLTWADILLLGIWESGAAVGVYNASTRTALLASFILLAINSVVAPRISGCFKLGDMPSLRKLTRNAALLSIFSTLPLFFIFVEFGREVLRVFGSEFVSGYSALIWVAVGQLVNAATGPVGHVLNMSGHHSKETYISCACVALNVLLSVVLIPRYGIEGAAFANCVAISICNFIRVAFVRLYVGIFVFPWIR